MKTIIRPPNCLTKLLRRVLATAILLSLCLAPVRSTRGEAMLEIFQLSWPEITAKMPEFAEAGYDSLYVPPPYKGTSGVTSYGYDIFDPFDLGNTNQAGTVPTMYGTQGQLIQMVQTAHRFGIRIYFDNLMNHRGEAAPGSTAYGTYYPTNFYPGLMPEDFHLQVTNDEFASWPDISDWCDNWQVENELLEGLCDLAQEPGTTNLNFGPSLGNTTNKPVWLRQPGRTDLYMDTNGIQLGSAEGTGWPSPPNGYGPVNGWRPFDGHGQPVADDSSTYLCRAVMWALWTSGCDGFRLDAVKHVPVNFFGNETGQSNDPSFGGYTGGIQAMFDYVHGYGNNVDTNGYIETDGNRNSLFNTEAPRNDAMLFGEHEPQSLNQGEDYYDYLNSGMRLENFTLFNEFNVILQNYGSSPGMYGMDASGYCPSVSEQANCDSDTNFGANQAVNMPMDQDNGYCCPANQTLEDSYFFTHEGLPMVYSDGFNHNTSGGTPVTSYYNYLGEFGDNSGPDMMYLHNQLSRGSTWPRWSDQNTVLYERYDYRDSTNSDPSSQAVLLFGMNDDLGYPGDITFDDGVTRPSDGYYLVSTNTGNGSASADTSLSNTRGEGIVVGFPPGTLLTQLSSSGDVQGGYRAYHQLLVHGATTSLSEAQSTTNAAEPAERLIYVGSQTLATNGGAIELVIPSGAWVMYGVQWPQPSQDNPYTNAIILTQGGVPAPTITIYRQDGPNGQTGYSPLFPFKMRGGVDPYGNIVYQPGEGNVSNLTYAINIPVITNAPFNILVNSDASCSNTLVKLDGGIDLNSQMKLGPTNFQAGIAPTNFLDLRDNPPGYADDVYLGYEQTAFQFRNGPEKFAARNTNNNTVVSLGAETYSYTVGGGSNDVAGSGYGNNITNATAAWVWHDPTNTITASGTNAPSQRNPLSPTANQSVDIWVRVAYQFWINTGYIYYTTNGTTPAGDFGIGKGATQVIPLYYVAHDSVNSSIDWWKATIPGVPSGTQINYQISLFNGGSYGVAVGNTTNWPSISPITNSEPSGSKLFGLTQAAITNFNPSNAVVWIHDDLNPANTYTGLQTGLHIIRARTFLPRNNQAGVYNTFFQTFYYVGPLPTGAIASPAASSTLTNTTAVIAIRADNSVTAANVNIQDTDTNSWDIHTGQANGIGNNASGAPIFVSAPCVTPNLAWNGSYPNYPQEFDLEFPYVPTSRVVTINVQLKQLFASTVYTNRYTTLSETVTGAAPSYASTYTNMFLRGTMNGWGDTQMTLVSNHLWQATATLLYQTSYQYKFEVTGQGTWGTNWGQNGSSTNSSSSGMALIDGNNLYYSTTASTNYTFDFNDSTLAYSVAPGGINALGGSPPQVPTGLTAVPVSGNQIDLTWSHSGGLATSYTIYESTSSTSGFTSIGTTVGTTFNVSGLAANTTYYYYLTASDNYGTSSDSTTASATTPSYTANYTNMFLRGTMNGWGATEMSLVSNDLWQVTVLLQANTNYQYKYEVSGLSTWSTSWGESGNSTNSTSSGTAVQSGNNIYYSTGPGTVYTFDFDDSSLAYSVAAAGEGSLVVVGGLARPKITFSLSGANLTLSWPSTYSTWVLQERTNTMGAGTWLNVTGVTGTSVTIDMKPIKLATGTVFYRLAPPQ